MVKVGSMRRTGPTIPRSRQRILESARELFYHGGFHATSVDDILDRSNVAKSNFYYHFASKEELAHAVLDSHIAGLQLLTTLSIANRDLSPDERLVDFFSRIAKAQRSARAMGGCPFGNLAAALPSASDGGQSDRLRERICSVFDSVEQTLEGWACDARDAGHLRAGLTPEEAAALLLATIEGSLLLGKARSDPALLDRNFDVLSRVVLADRNG